MHDKITGGIQQKPDAFLSIHRLFQKTYHMEIRRREAKI